MSDGFHEPRLSASPLDAPPTFEDIAKAGRRLTGRAVRTPLLSVPALDAATGATVLVKPEVLQRTGSFKFRGAYNFLAQLLPDVRASGVVTSSSGNHAQGVAAAAAYFGVPATIVMPADAPAAKIEGTKALGGRVVTYDRQREDREAIAGDIARQTGATLVPPFDHPWIIAGQGTVGAEIAAQADAANAALDAVLVPCSGGGLTAGIATALAELAPAARVWTVEPAGYDDTARSLAAGHRLQNEPGAASLCDALLVGTPGALTFAINSRLCAGGVTVSDAEVVRAMAFAYRHLKLVVEPGGAAALAALLAGRPALKGKTVAVVLSGGNVDRDTFAAALAAA
ncbi:MAG: threonine/serine dehydratase [Alphaproteobacteria bacterium]